MDTLSELETTEDTSAETGESPVVSYETPPDFDNLPEPEDFSVEELPRAANSTDNFEELTTIDLKI